MDICPCNICPGDICPYQQYLCCYWPYFDQILKVGSWDLSDHIPTDTMTFVQATFVHATFVQVTSVQAAISLELLIRTWSNFECQAAMVLATTVQVTSVQGTFDHATNVHSTIVHVTIEMSSGIHNKAHDAGMTFDFN